MLSLFQRLGLGTRKDRYPGASINTSASIRVLKLKRMENDRIDCKLKTIDIATCGESAYDALSYRWGDIADPKTIHCNGVSFKVQRSLFQAFWRIWSKDPELLLWVDAVCINQNDYAELSSQVKIMGTIYQRAHRVIIWLGEADEFTDLAWRALLEASAPASSIHMNELEAQLKKLSDLEDIWLSLHNLGQREWFYRAWTFQELFLARCATVICSDYEMDWDRFHSALNCLAMLLPHIAPSTYSMKATDTLQRILGSVENTSISDTNLTLTDLLRRTIHRSCDEPKDKIYALLGILFRKNGLKYSKDYLPIDYSKNPELVYTQVSYALAVRSEWTEPGRVKSEPLDLSILHGAGMDAHNRRYRTTWFKGLKVNKKLGDLPSWVVDWTDNEAALSWREQTFARRHKWRPIVNTDGLKFGAAVNPHDSGVKSKELLLYGVALARLIHAQSKANDHMEFYLEDLPRCVCSGNLLSHSGGSYPYIRWTSQTPIEDQSRYPNDSASHIYHSPKVLRALAKHDLSRCECSRTPFFHTIIASVPALIVSIVFSSYATYIFILVCWIVLKDIRIQTGKSSRNFCLDIGNTKEHPTVAAEGDWIVSLAGEQGLFILKPAQNGKFKLVRGLLQHEDIQPSYQVSRIDSNGNKLVDWTSQYQTQNRGLSATPSWRDFRVLPISLSIV
ncbi:heterokaryon incompatibility protein-domain-containing protein [Xylaria flabelliformis]|nr:heterokaryon incompatibility protein-domain-containing protein [Xylaria flabelliformis]